MTNFILPLFLLLLSSSAEAKQRLAVLEFAGFGIDDTLLLQLSDEARGGAREGLPIAGFDITSRENIEQMLADMGRSIEECNSECEVTLGRELGADYVLSGSAYSMQGRNRLTLKLHDTHSGSLLAQRSLTQRDNVQLLDQTYAISKTMMQEYVAINADSSSTQLIRMRFDSNPNGPGTTVQVSGELVCTQTPCEENVPAGVHEVTILRKGYFPWREQRDLQPNARLSATLRFKSAVLTVDTVPKQLSRQLSLNGKAATLQRQELAPGKHTVWLRDDCYVAEGVELKLEAGADERITLEPQPRRSAIEIVTYNQREPVPAQLYVDGKFLGDTPYRGVVPLCSEQLRVVSRGLSATHRLSGRLQERQLYSVDLFLK